MQKDYSQAVFWARKAADLGDARGQCALGNCYYYGDGVLRDYEQAAFWFQKAADHGHRGAQAALGDCYEFGRGVPQDYVAAYQWYDLSAGHVLRFAAAFRDEIAKKLTPKQLAEAKRRSSEFRAKLESQWNRD